MEISTLISIFYSNYNGKIDYDGIYKINDLIKRDLIKIEQVEICDKGEYLNVIDKLNAGEVKIIDYQGGSTGHSALKVIAEKYIKENFQQNVSVEQNYFGRIPDVLSADNQIIFECGDTDPWKIIEYFRNNDNLQIFVLLYISERQNFLRAYKFIKNVNDLKNILLDEHAESLNIIKNIIKSRK